jgi:hypothetical protein
MFRTNANTTKVGLPTPQICLKRFGKNALEKLLNFQGNPGFRFIHIFLSWREVDTLAKKIVQEAKQFKF